MRPSLTNNAYSLQNVKIFQDTKNIFMSSRDRHARMYAMYIHHCVVSSLTINQEINHLLSESFLIRNPVEKRERDKKEGS